MSHAKGHELVAIKTSSVLKLAFVRHQLPTAKRKGSELITSDLARKSVNLKKLTSNRRAGTVAGGLPLAARAPAPVPPSGRAPAWRAPRPGTLAGGPCGLP